MFDINNPLPVSGVSGFTGGGGGSNVTIVAPIPLPVSGVTPQLVTVTNPTTSVTIPTPVPVSGVTPQLITQTNNPTFINISGIVSVSNQPIQISGVVDVNIRTNPVPVSGVTPQLVSIQGIPTISLSPLPVPVSGAVSFYPGSFSSVSGSVSITGTVPVSGVTPQLVTITNPTVSLTPLPVPVSGAVSFYPGAFSNISGVVSVSNTVAVSGVVTQLVVDPTISAQLPSTIGPHNAAGSLSIVPATGAAVIFNTSGVTPQLVQVQPLPLPVSGITPQLISGSITANVPTPLQVSGIVGLSPIPLPVSGVTTQLVQVQPLPLPVSGVTPQLVTIFNPLPLQRITITNSGILPNKNFLAAAISPSLPPSILRGYFCLNQSGVLNTMRTSGNVTVSESMNSASALVSGAAYIFDIEAFSGDSFNWQFTGSGTIVTTRVVEVPFQT